MTRDVLQGKITGLQRATASADGQLILKEIKEMKEFILTSGYMAKGEEAVRVLGVQQGLDIAMHLIDILVAQNNLGNKGLVKP